MGDLFSLGFGVDGGYGASGGGVPELVFLNAVFSTTSFA